MSKEQHQIHGHAAIVKDGYLVPLIGIAPEAVLETCDCCGDEIGMSETTMEGKNFYCNKCKTKFPSPSTTHGTTTI